MGRHSNAWHEEQRKKAEGITEPYLDNGEVAPAEDLLVVPGAIQPAEYDPVENELVLRSQMINVSIPIDSPPPNAYLSNHVNLQLWTKEEKRGLLLLRLGLMRQGEMSAKGRIVKDNSDAVRWMLAKISQQAE